MTTRQKHDLPKAAAFIAGYSDAAGKDVIDIILHVEIDDGDANQMAFLTDIEPAATAIWHARRNEEGCKGVHLHPQGSLPAMTVRLSHEGIVRGEDGVDVAGERLSFHWIGAAITSRPIVKIPSHDAFTSGENGQPTVILHIKQHLSEAQVSELCRLKGVPGVIEMYATNPDLDGVAAANGEAEHETAEA